MSEIELTQGKIALVDDEDFTALSQHKWFYMKVNEDLGYAARKINGSIIYMHNIIMNPLPSFQVDHINWNGIDNQKFNLRITTKSGNLQNKRKQSNKTSKFLGVSRDSRKPKWRSQAKLKQKKIALGLYDNEEDAAKAYDEKVLELHGEHALTNKRLGLL